MSEPNSLKSRIEVWLNKTGYPLEMRTQRALSEADVVDPDSIYPNSYYIDPTTKDFREVDLILSWHAEYAGTIFHITLVIECKSTDDPWVVFTHWSDPSGAPPLFDPSSPVIQTTTENAKGPALFAAIELEGVFEEIEPMELSGLGYTIVTAFKEKNKLDTAESAIKQVLSAAYNIGLPDRSVEHWEGTTRSIPVIITTSPLFEAFLDESGELCTRRVNQTSVLGPVPGSNNQNSTRVVIYNEDALPDLIESCRELQNAMKVLEDIPDNDTLWATANRDEEGQKSTEGEANDSALGADAGRQTEDPTKS